MPAVRYALSAAVRGLRAFLNLEAGVVRAGAAPPPETRRVDLEQQGEVEWLRGLLAARDRQIAALRAMRNGAGDVKPENIVWIFGVGRSGNTWLSDMMEDAGHAVWREPSVGRLFGEFYFLRSRPGQLGTHNYILGERQRETWLRSIRRFVLDNADGRFPGLGDRCLVVKEQVGTIGAPLLVDALPESRMILLIRDPRDTAASALNGTRKGGWRHGRLGGGDLREAILATEDPTTYVEEWAAHYLQAVGKGKDAYEAHRGRKTLVRYEDLTADALGVMRRLHSALGIAVDQGGLSRAVEKHSWEKIPENEKGEGKFRRKATPGGWREDLTPEQVEVIERITAPLLEEFYPTRS